MSNKLDSRLTDFSFQDRHAAPVAKIIDTHVHYNGDKADLDSLVSASKACRIETIFVIEMDSPDRTQWLKEVDDAFGIGKGAIPFYRLNLQSNNPDQVKKAFDLGFWGLKWIYPSTHYDDRFFDPLLAEAQKLQMANLFHTGVVSAGQKTGSGMSLMRADMLDTLAKRYPKLLIQGAHLGCPNIDEAVWGSEMCDNLIWDCSGGCRFHCLADPLVLHSATFMRKKSWKAITFASDVTSGVFPPEWADGWGTAFEHRIATWQKILASLPIPLTTEQLDDFFYNNVKRWMDRIKKGRELK